MTAQAKLAGTRHEGGFALLKIYLLGAVVASSVLAMPASAATNAPTLQDQEQAACYDDVQRLCQADVPDVDKVTACMKTKRSQVSAKCAKFYK